jgi:hypothetical protein
VRQLVVPLSLNGCAIRDISRVLHLSTNTVLKLLRRHAAKVHRPRLPEHITELEIDEMWSFVGSKQQQAWLWYAFEPQLNCRNQPHTVAATSYIKANGRGSHGWPRAHSSSGQCPHPINRERRKDSPPAQLLLVYKSLFSFVT